MNKYTRRRTNDLVQPARKPMLFSKSGYIRDLGDMVDAEHSRGEGEARDAMLYMLVELEIFAKLQRG